MAGPASVSRGVPLRGGRLWVGLALAVADLLALALALVAGLWLREALGAKIHWEVYRPLWPMLLLFPLFFVGMGAYPAIGLAPATELRRTTFAVSLGFLALAAASFLLKVPGARYSRGAFLLAWALALVLVPLARSLTRHLLARQPWWGEPVVILGTGATARSLARFLLHHPELGLRPVGFLHPDGETAPTNLEGLPVLGQVSQAPQWARRGVRYAVVALPEWPFSRVSALLETHLRAFSRVLLVPDLPGTPTLWIVPRDLGGILGLEVPRKLLVPPYPQVKRGLDLVLLVLLAPVWLPLLAVSALLVRLSSPGPVFFRQQRLGRGGRPFWVYKFRTMYVDAEARLEDVLARDPALREEYRRFHKLRRDPRVTPVGRFLRRFSLDELPQVWNVFRGEMSLVGPRAYMPQEREAMGPWAGIILQVPPGMTGLWQVSGRNLLPFEDRLRLDVYYVRNWSPWLDFYILAKTVKVVLTGEGAF